MRAGRWREHQMQPTDDHRRTERMASIFKQGSGSKASKKEPTPDPTKPLAPSPNDGLRPHADLALLPTVEDLETAPEIDSITLPEKVDAQVLRDHLKPKGWRLLKRDAVFVLDNGLPEAIRCEPSFSCLRPGALPALVDVLEQDRSRPPATIAVPQSLEENVAGQLERAEDLGAQVQPLSTLIEERCRHLPLERERVDELGPPSLSKRFVKRCFDLVVASVGCLVLLLTVGPVAVAIWLEDRGPVFYRQKRVGRMGKDFKLLKFRSMREDAENSGPKWASSIDGRLTNVGRGLRRYHIDELPQFINVLRGDMSTVGPRPERPVFVRVLREHVPYYDHRHAVRPGLTGWATVKVGYSNSIAAKRVALQYDLYHVENWTLAFDVAILARTAGHLIVRPEVRDRLMI